jgi:hypothetical protein
MVWLRGQRRRGEEGGTGARRLLGYLKASGKFEQSMQKYFPPEKE